MRFDYKGDNENGILRYFYDKLSNDEYNNEVCTYSNSINDPLQLSEYAVDFDHSKYWHAVDSTDLDKYIVIYLKHYLIKLTGFSITSSPINPNNVICHPKNWGFDASIDNATWENRINYTDSNNQMNRYLASGHYSWNFGTYKYFRFMITGEQYDNVNKYSIDLNQIEFFGDLLENPEDIISCWKKRRFNLNIISLLWIFICSK